VPGSGLGLALCQRIMRLHGGAIRVAASSPEGTTFELTFPERR
jgi:signal transduction histidine kinase